MILSSKIDHSYKPFFDRVTLKIYGLVIYCFQFAYSHQFHPIDRDVMNAQTPIFSSKFKK